MQSYKNTVFELDQTFHDLSSQMWYAFMFVVNNFYIFKFH